MLPDKVLDFSALYKQNCAGCHGSDGNLGAALPLNDSLFRAIVPEEELTRVISIGRPGTPMPAFARENGGSLTAAQIRVLVDEIKGTHRKPGANVTGWGVPKSPPENVPSYLMGKAASERTSDAYEQIRKTTYARACADCHGDHGQGGDEAGPINDPALLSLTSDQALRRLIITGRSDLGMPDFADAEGRPADFKPLSAAEVADLVELLAHWRKIRPPQATANSSYKPIPRAD